MKLINCCYSSWSWMLMSMYSWIIFSCCVRFHYCRPLDGTEKTVAEPKKLQLPTVETFNFLTRFGYLDQGPADAAALYNEDAVEEAIKNVQKFGALPQTGVIDNATLNLMVSPRCGREDVLRSGSNRQKRFVVGSYGWKKRLITYFIANWTPQLSKEDVAKNIQKAFDAWGSYGRLQFKEVSHQNADIIVAFASGDHGDGYSFDGPGSVVAHAFYPYEHGYGGDVHFDADESWTVNPEKDQDSFDFYNVAVHEIGHSLGLAHSPVPSSIMFPYYQGYNGKLVLDYDDILAMYQLYIQRPIEGNETLSDFSTTTPRSKPTIRTTTVASTRSTTVPYYSTRRTTTRRSTVTTERYRPEVTSQRWNVTYEDDFETVDDHKKHDTTHGIPPSVPPILPTISTIPDICEGYFDAVSVFRGELFIFKGEYLWRLRQRGQILDGYPVPFKHMFQKLPNRIKRIDAAYERDDGMMVLFTGNEFWVYDGYDFIENSPRRLTDLKLPPILDKLDAVLLWNKNKKTYYFRREMFWRANGTTNVMDKNYPQKVMQRWRGLPEDIDAAIVWTDGNTYFFKNTLVWRFDSIFIEVADGYPVPAPQSWLGCPEKPNSVWW